MSDFRNFSEAGAALHKLDEKAIELAKVEDGLEKGYANLGWLLLEVSQMQYWRVYHPSFRDYLKELAIKSRTTPEQLQRYFLTVRDLSDTFTIEQLEAIGITKAMNLRKAKDYAIVLPQAVIDAALDHKITSKDLKKVISVALKMPDEEDGDWLDLEFEFMVTPEQRAFAEQVINVAMHTEPVTKSTVSKSAQMWDVFEKLGQEFLAGHNGDGN